MSERPMFTDADLTHDWATRWRIPLLSKPYAEWAYEVALAVPRALLENRGRNLYDLVWPTEEEARIVSSYIDYRRDWYRTGYQNQMLERALDVDGGTNTVILAKTSVGWKYRRASYSHGLWPHIDLVEEQAKYPPTPEGLIALICWINSIGGTLSTRFAAWASEHGDVWPADLVHER